MFIILYHFPFGATGKNDDYLATRFRSYEVGNNLGKRATHSFLVKFRDFAANSHLAIRAEVLGKLRQRLHQAVG